MRDYKVTGVQTCALPIQEVGSHTPSTAGQRLRSTRTLNATARIHLRRRCGRVAGGLRRRVGYWALMLARSEEHTSELQSPCNLVCRLLLEKKKQLTHALASRLAPYGSAAARRSPDADSRGAARDLLDQVRPPPASDSHAHVRRPPCCSPAL